MEIADKNTQDFRPGSSSEVKSISREVLRKGRGKFVDRSKTQLSQTGSKGLKCFRCAGSHAPNLCKFKDERCYVCSKRGHITKVCRAKDSNNKSFKTKYVHQELHDSDAEDPVGEELGLYRVYTTPGKGKYQANVQIDGEKIVMEIDMGAAVPIIPEEIYETKLSNYPLIKSDVVLKTYSGECLRVLGEVQLPVQ